MLITLFALLKQVLMGVVTILLAIAVITLLANLTSRFEKRARATSNDRERVEGEQ